jgi:hypothetical protein
LKEQKPGIVKTIERIENEARIGYPEVYLVYVIIFGDSGNLYEIDHGVTSDKQAVDDPMAFSEVVYLSGFSAMMLEKDIFTEVLIEEFLHHVFRNKSTWRMGCRGRAFPITK